jgi:branched-chain amino acid transport system ATP-binding protein
MCNTLTVVRYLMMIDEPTEGLCPQMVQRVASLLKVSTNRGIATLPGEQKMAIAMKFAHQVHLMGHGKVVCE